MCSAAETPAFSRCRRRPPRRPTPRWRGSRSEKPRKALARPAASWPASFWPAGFRPAASPAHRTAHGRMLNFGGGHVMDASPLKILCITGWCRSGSTIIGNILGEIAGVFHVGELHFLWKNPGEAALLPHLDGVRPYFVHLVRDPRAVAQSWRQPKQYVYTMSSAMSTAYWHGFNLAAHAITDRYPERSMLLRYEDFIADPAGTIDALLRLCGADPATNPMRGRMIDLHPNHTVTGNPDRFRTGATIIRETDESWKTGLSLSAKLAAVMLSWPLFRSYGYRHGGMTTGPIRAGVHLGKQGGRLRCQ